MGMTDRAIGMKASERERQAKKTKLVDRKSLLEKQVAELQAQGIYWDLLPIYRKELKNIDDLLKGF